MKIQFKVIIAVFAAFAVFTQTKLIVATELVSPATQLGDQKVHIEVYYRHLAKQDMVVTVGGGSSVNVGASTITTSSVAEADVEGSGDGTMAKITFQPYDGGLRYYVVGGLSTYDLKVPSGTQSISFSSSFFTASMFSLLGIVFLPSILN